MAIVPSNNYSNPGTVDPTPGFSATPAYTGKPIRQQASPGVKPVIPGMTSLQQSAQANVPGTPNNGNPGGIHNAPQQPPGFRTRVGGGYIGKAPEGARQAANGVYYGGGTLTDGQREYNQASAQQFQQQEQMRAMMPQQAAPMPQLSPEIMARFRELAQQGINGNNQRPPKPGMSVPNQGGGGLPTSGGLPVSQMPSGPGMGQVAPYQTSNIPAPIPQSAPQLDFQGFNTNTYYGGQNPNLGRYRPPQMIPGGGWADNGGYNYNLPNAYGPYPNYQTGPYGYGNGYGS